MIKLTCDCGQKLTISEKEAGKKGRCPACKGIIYIPWNKNGLSNNLRTQKTSDGECSKHKIIKDRIIDNPNVRLRNRYRSSKSRLVYIILALFLGGLGVHNFYAGRIGKGMTQLLIALFLGWLILPLLIIGLWVIIEIITVNTDGNGDYFG